ncbi:hypothetical protein BC833DRAFT_507258, partial [Globomyces pollinis-pini]
ATGNEGINVLLHGDGGQSFFAFPNAKAENNLIGVSVLAPNAAMKWGGNGNDRPDGPAHAKLIADLITNELPKRMKFDASKVFFTGVSGGSLTLTSAMLPLFGNQFPSGMFLLCGGLKAAQDIPANAVNANTRIHVQTTQNELASLKATIPDAITQIQQAFTTAGVNQNQLTVDGAPNGGHCAFDGLGFGSGIQLMLDNFGKVM